MIDLLGKDWVEDALNWTKYNWEATLLGNHASYEASTIDLESRIFFIRDNAGREAGMPTNVDTNIFWRTSYTAI